ncbi:hypothetical protein HOG07_05450, partial [Candidatus Woesearchaeota archaeon]|nr:hypothetical protein [Candidatus Woesearchaeota archaeon]
MRKLWFLSVLLISLFLLSGCTSVKDTLGMCGHYCVNKDCGTEINNCGQEIDCGGCTGGHSCEDGMCELNPEIKDSDPILVRPKIDLNLLLSNQRITNAIELNPLTTTNNYQKILNEKISDLEVGNTAHWNNFRSQANWQEEDLLELYLQKVAFSLYIEANALTPWSILDYSDEHLNLLLSDLYVDDVLTDVPMYQNGGYYKARKQSAFNGDSLIAFKYIQETKQQYPHLKVKTHKDLLDLIIIRMRDDEWVHFGSEAEGCSDFPSEVMNYDFQCLLDLKKGSDPLTAHFIFALLQSNNIPSKEVPVYLGGHTGIIYPTLDLTMEGNAVYSVLKKGILTTNKLPIDNTYLDLNTYLIWDQVPTCQAFYFTTNKNVLDYFQYIGDPQWNTDIITTYCYTFMGNAPGEYL